MAADSPAVAQPAPSSGAGGVPSEVELVGALSDALIPTVKCLKPYWRRVATEVRRLLLEEQAEKEGAVDGHPEADASQPPPLLRAALAMVREDLKAIRRSQTEARANA